MELGLHCGDTWARTGGSFLGELRLAWTSRLWWCVFVLDRKFSFGTGLPFAIQDSDIDADVPEPVRIGRYASFFFFFFFDGSLTMTIPLRRIPHTSNA